MKNPLIHRTVAAAALLLPLGAALVAAPAQAQYVQAPAWEQPAPVYVQPGERHERGEWRQRRLNDDRPPQIFDVSPANGDRVDERGRTHIFARLEDRGSGIDPASVRLRLDGYDVSRFTRISADGVHFRDELAPGRHVAELAVSDRAGNTTRRTWTFHIAGGFQGQQHGQWEGQNAPRRW